MLPSRVSEIRCGHFIEGAAFKAHKYSFNWQRSPGDIGSWFSPSYHELSNAMAFVVVRLAPVELVVR
jgi:hypothetical protein